MIETCSNSLEATVPGLGANLFFHSLSSSVESMRQVSTQWQYFSCLFSLKDVLLLFFVFEGINLCYPVFLWTKLGQAFGIY